MTRIKWADSISVLHADVSEHVGIRVSLLSNGWEWAVFVGPKGRRVLHTRDFCWTAPAARRKAIREGRKTATIYK